MSSPEKEIMEQKQAINIYVCRSCGKETVTINDVDGTTPFMILCTDETCQSGVANSRFYPPSAQQKLPTHEWYRPSQEELAAKGDEILSEHVQRGGLVLREITEDRKNSRYKGIFSAGKN